MEVIHGIIAIEAATRKEWRNWLKKNQHKEKAVWLIIYHKSSPVKSVYYAEAVEEALCFGWIDSKKIKRDFESVYQTFTKRKPKSVWSNLNKSRVKDLTEKGLMTKSGQEMINIAKKTGTWDVLTDAQNSVIPPDLKKLFAKNKPAFKNFTGFSPSSKRFILEWISNAKKPETRQKRIEETVALAAKNMKANHPHV